LKKGLPLFCYSEITGKAIVWLLSAFFSSVLALEAYLSFSSTGGSFFYLLSYILSVYLLSEHLSSLLDCVRLYSELRFDKSNLLTILIAMMLLKGAISLLLSYYFEDDYSFSSSFWLSSSFFLLS